MDIPSEALWVVLALVALGIVITLIVFFAWQGGIFRISDLLLGFFR